MFNLVKVPTKSVDFVRRLFPDYRKRDVNLLATTRVTFMDLNWSGGTRSTYSIVRLEDNAVASLSAWSTLAPWENPHEGSTIDLKPGFLVVRTGFFCGKVSTMTVYVHPSNLTPLLGEPMSAPSSAN
jgi:hypothetical protein